MSEPVAWVKASDVGNCDHSMIAYVRQPNDAFIPLYSADEIERKDAAIAELKSELQASLLQERAECDRADAAIAELVQALQSAINQVEYLHEAFNETGSGNGFISQCKHLIAKYDTPKDKMFQVAAELMKRVSKQ